MKTTTIRTLALAAFMANSGYAMAADATNPCKGLDQPSCSIDRGCAWVQTTTTTSDGAKSDRAACRFNAKAARSALAKLLPKS